MSVVIIIRNINEWNLSISILFSHILFSYKYYSAFIELNSVEKNYVDSQGIGENTNCPSPDKMVRPTALFKG